MYTLSTINCRTFVFSPSIDINVTSSGKLLHQAVAVQLKPRVKGWLFESLGLNTDKTMHPFMCTCITGFVKTVLMKRSFSCTK